MFQNVRGNDTVKLSIKIKRNKITNYNSLIGCGLPLEVYALPVIYLSYFFAVCSQRRCLLT